MGTQHEEKLHWTICPSCCGQGKILKEPSRKKQRLFQIQLEKYKAEGSIGVAPASLVPKHDACPHCEGSGLQRSTSAVLADFGRYPTIGIIGGGIGGVALAVACLHRGIPFTLYERDESFDVRSQGYGLTLQQASKAIEGLGVFSLEGGITSTKHVVHDPEGKIIGEWGLRKWMNPFIEKTTRRKNVHIARQTLRSLLLEELGNSESVKWGHTLTDFSHTADGAVTLSFQVEERQVAAQADLLVGADGIRSVVRKKVIGEEKTPLQYLGCMVILGICSLKSLRLVSNSLLDSATVFQTVNGHERIYMMPYDKDTIMWQLSFPCSEEDAKALSTRGVKAMKKESLKRLQQWHDPIPQILEATAESEITGYPVYDRKLFSPQYMKDNGNVTLLGDAAHPMSPFKGQGANQALLDALLLARSITRECDVDPLWREKGIRKVVLNAFEEEMAERSASKVIDSAKAAKLLHSKEVLEEGDEPRGRG